MNKDNGVKIVFEGEQNQIDANTLINSLIHTSSLVHELNRYMDSGKRVDVKINTFEKGSFIVDIEIIESTIGAIKTIFTKESAILLGTLAVQALLLFYTWVLLNSTYKRIIKE